MKVELRRLLALASWTLLAPVLAGAMAVEGKIERIPVQLALPFEAAGAATRLTPSVSMTGSRSASSAITSFHAAPVVGAFSPAPVPAAVPSAVAVKAAPTGTNAPLADSSAAHWATMPPEVAKAFRDGDPREFWKACKLSGFAPPASDDAMTGLLDRGAELHEADRQALALFSPSAKTVRAEPAKTPARKRKFDDAGFAAGLAAYPGLDLNVFRHSAAKRDILRRAKYTHVYGRGGVRIPLEDASDAQIGEVFASALSGYRRRTAP